MLVDKRLWIVLGIFLTLIALIVYFKRNLPLDECRTKISLKNLSDILQTGDLLILSGNTLGEHAIKTYTLWDFSHISLVIKSDSEVWLWEADIGQHYKDGPRAITLEDKLTRWKGDSMVRVCKTGLKINPEALETVIKELLPQEMDMEMWSWMFGPKHKTPGTWFCSELVVHTLNKTTNWKSKNLPLYYSPKRLVSEMVDNFQAECKDYEPSSGKW